MPAWVHGMFGVSDGISGPTARLQNLGDFDSFIRDNIPYGQVDPKSFQWGFIQYDGPESGDEFREAKSLLQWHFRGEPYPITRAVRLEYSYERKWDGSDTLVSAALLFGFQNKLSDHLEVTAAPLGRLPSFQLKAFNALQQQQALKDGSTKPAPDETADQRQAREAKLRAARTEQLKAIRTAMLAEPTTVTTGLPAKLEGIKELSLNAFIKKELEDDATITYDVLKQQLINVQFDGPAQNADSHKAFPYTLQTLWNEQDKYNELLWWYFAGTATRVTKAMRIPFDESDDDSHSLLIGFTGPGTTPV